MKKILIWLMALTFLALPLFSLAEGGASAELVDFSSKEYGFSMKRPSQWMVWSKETVAENMKMIEQGKIKAEGMSQPVVDSIVRQVEQMDITMIMSQWGGSNVNVVRTPSQGVGDLADKNAVGQMTPLLEGQFKQMFTDFALTVPGEPVRLSGRDYLHIEGTYTLNGKTNRMIQYYTVAGEYMYIITFTLIEGDSQVPDVDALIKPMIESFTPIS